MSSVNLSNSNISIADDQFNLIPSCKKTSFDTSNQYSDYLLSCVKKKNSSGLFFYYFPSSLILYSGDVSYNKNSHNTGIIPNGKMCFNLNAQDASQKGDVHEFTLKQPIELLSLDDTNNFKYILDSAQKAGKTDVIIAFKRNYGKAKIRDPLNDFKILDYLCSIGFSGFATKSTNSNSAELFICKSEKYLSTGIYSKYNKQFLLDVNDLI